MFQRSRYPTSSSATQGTYTRIQQQDDYDDDYDDLAHELLHHPNSLVVTDELDSAIAPSLTQSPPPVVEDNHAIAEDEDTSFSARASFSAKRAAEFPNATRQFIKSKLPFRKAMAAEASFASLPSVVMADIQHGDIPAQSDPLHKELPKRGWTIVRRRRFRGRRRMRGHKKHVQIRAPLTFTEALSCTDPIYSSVFVKWTPENQQEQEQQERPISPTIIKDHHSVIPVNKDDFATIMQSVRTAIDDHGIQPTRISQGSSGSYFCRNTQGKIVGVFKPKNEEPYGRLNPKWTKWIHRHLFPCCFGRSCLIPNLGYISEAASSLVDRRLGTNIVPFTEVVHLASPSFHYDYLDRRSAAVVGLPPKIGSFQCFLDGFKDANVFMREHPYPVESYSSSSLRLSRAGWAGCLGEQDDVEELDSEGEEAQEMFVETAQSEGEHEASQHQQRLLRAPSTAKFRWTHRLQDQFKLEFEQLVLLDYLIRNTDRGLDNWMLKYCGFEASGRSTPNSGSNASRVTLHDVREHVHLAAIDNGLAFPFKHPDQWRSYPYGWLALPESLVARPFSESTRTKYLAILSDPLWWQETVRQLRDLSHVDSDFDDRMFERQVAVLKGQGYNIVRCLSDPTGSPLDLVSLERVLVNQEEILIAYDEKIIRSRNPEAIPNEDAFSPGRASRLRTKRSTSFDLAMHRPYMDEEMRIGDSDPQQTSAPVPLTTWKQRMRNRISVDMGRRRRRRMMKNLRLGRRHVSSDGENEDSDSSSSEEDAKKSTIKCVTIIMETLEVVKSRPPYFTCC